MTSHTTAQSPLGGYWEAPEQRNEWEGRQPPISIPRGSGGLCGGNIDNLNYRKDGSMLDALVNYVLATVLLTPRPPHLWANVPTCGLQVCGPLNAAVTREGRVIVLQREDGGTRAHILVPDEDRYSAHRLLSVSTGSPADLGSMPRALERLEPVVACGGRLTRGLSWDSWQAPSGVPFTWQPDPVQRGLAITVRLKGRKCTWIVARSGGGITVSRHNLLNQVGAVNGQPFDFGDWHLGMQYCEEKEKASRPP